MTNGKTRKRLLVLAFLLVFFVLAGCGYEPLDTPAEPDYDPICKAVVLPKRYNDVFWFVHITDIEQTRLSGSDLFSYSIQERSSYRGFRDQLRYICNTVQPAFVVATGDLVYGGVLSQEPAQWKDYNRAVRAACFDSSNYHDMPGNHDVYYSDDFSYFLRYSISREIHHDWSFENGNARFAFAAFNTARPGYGGGYFTNDESDWLSGTLGKYSDYDYRFVFAHHNTPEEMPELYESDSVLRNFGVSVFFGGHTHKNDELNIDGLLSIRTAAIYKSAGGDKTDGAFRIVSIDDGAFATAPKWIFNHGPQVLVTHPQDKSYETIGDPVGHIVSGPTHVRALAFSEEDVALFMIVDDGDAVPMEKIDGNLHQASIDFSAFEKGEHRISVLVPGAADQFNSSDAVIVVKE